jgi:HSP20 family protein
MSQGDNKIVERPFEIIDRTMAAHWVRQFFFAADQSASAEPVICFPRLRARTSHRKFGRYHMPEPTKLPIKKETRSAVSGPASWRPFESLRREIDQAFDNFGWRSWPLPFTRPMFQTDVFRDKAWDIAPAVDVAEKEKEFEITAELPGLDDKNVEVKLSNGTLTIKGEKNEEKEEREKDYYLSERRYGSFVRSFSVPEGVNADKIEANFAKGVLTIKLPKTAEAQAEKKIPVKAA